MTFRTLDIGADKVAALSAPPREDNPALGWRAIRMALERPALLRLQLRALLKAGGGARTQDHVPDDRRGGRVPRRARGGAASEMAYLERRGHQLPRR